MNFTRITIALFFSLMSFQMYAQSSFDEFIAKFPDVPSNISNFKLRTFSVDRADITSDYKKYIDKPLSSLKKIIPVAKLATRRAYVLLFAEVHESYKGDQPMIYVHSIALSKKGKIIEKSVEKYLTSSGQLSHKKEMYYGSITKKEKFIYFTSETIHDETESENSVKTKVYTVKNNKLVFVKNG